MMLTVVHIDFCSTKIVRVNHFMGKCVGHLVCVPDAIAAHDDLSKQEKTKR
jgi:hypothetical protein